jgi:2'-5' RNA ligase
VAGDTAPLAALAEGLRERLLAGGLTLDTRPFRPHLTIARAVQTRRPDAAAALAALENYTGPPWTVRQVVLVRSTLEPGGARHEPIAAAALGGRAGFP